jgi:hypothetical protein
VPPPGAGLVTVTQPEPALAMAELGTFALSCEELTKLVLRAVPFQLTFEPEAEPEPFKVSVNPAAQEQQWWAQGDRCLTKLGLDSVRIGAVHNRTKRTRQGRRKCFGPMLPSFYSLGRQHPRDAAR